MNNETPITNDYHLEALLSNGTFIKDIEQNEEMCIEAVKRNGMALRYVKEQTPDICREAMNQNRNTFKYVEHKFQTLFRRTEY